MRMTKMTVFARMAAVMVTTVFTLTAAKAQDRFLYYPEHEHAAVQVRTNGLYDLAVCPNVGLEIQTDLGIAFQADYIGAWWNSPSRNRYYSNYALQAGIRYYLEKCGGNTFPYTGHHVGIYGQMITFDFEFGGKGYMSRNLNDTWGLGMEYGYSLPLSRRFCLDFTLGLGYLHSHYLVYHPSGEIYIPDNYKDLDFFGPTRLEVTLVWNINKSNRKYTKSYFAL